MRKEVKHYQGIAITREVINEMFHICANRNFKVEGTIPYEDISSIDDITHWYECEPDEMNVIIGQDWFITYIDNGGILEIVEWVSRDDIPDKFRQSLEMKKYIIKLLIDSKEKCIEAVMRHSTSYRFYEALKKHGYIDELYNMPGMDQYIPFDIQLELDRQIEKNVNIKGYLANEARNKEYDEYFHHEIEFYLTDKFFDKYSKSSIKK